MRTTQDLIKILEEHQGVLRQIQKNSQAQQHRLAHLDPRVIPFPVRKEAA